MDGPDGVLAQSQAPGTNCDYKALTELRSQIRSSSISQSRGCCRIVAFMNLLLFLLSLENGAVWVNINSRDDGV